MKNDGGPAFPIPESNIVRDGYQSISTGARGMALRDWFAGQALASISVTYNTSPAEIADFVYQIATAMLDERNKNST